MSRLNNSQVELIEMRYFEKIYREIGEILDITENNAKVKTFRALKNSEKILRNLTLKQKKLNNLKIVVDRKQLSSKEIEKKQFS